MSKRILKSRRFANLQTALNTPPDYSKAFTGKVKLLAEAIGAVFAGRVEHDDDMNYSSAQTIAVWLNGVGEPVPSQDRQAMFRLLTYVSSRGPYFTLVTLKLSAAPASWGDKRLGTPRQVWCPVVNGDVPRPVKVYHKKIASLIESNGYIHLSGAVLSREVEGHVTELDGKPATVFEVLFSEV